MHWIRICKGYGCGGAVTLKGLFMLVRRAQGQSMSTGTATTQHLKCCGTRSQVWLHTLILVKPSSPASHIQSIQCLSQRIRQNDWRAWHMQYGLIILWMSVSKPFDGRDMHLEVCKTPGLVASFLLCGGLYACGPCKLWEAKNEVELWQPGMTVCERFWLQPYTQNFCSVRTKKPWSCPFWRSSCDKVCLFIQSQKSFILTDNNMIKTVPLTWTLLLTDANSRGAHWTLMGVYRQRIN